MTQGMETGIVKVLKSINGGSVVTIKNETYPCPDQSPDTPAGAGHVPAACCIFKIRARGQLSDLWADWFEGLSIEQCENGEMVLSGPIVDQAALMGVLNNEVTNT
jgi:hypothetical protein